MCPHTHTYTNRDTDTLVMTKNNTVFSNAFFTLNFDMREFFSNIQILYTLEGLTVIDKYGWVKMTRKEIIVFTNIIIA